jgi:uncharacterized protein YecE (DUF72 family)
LAAELNHVLLRAGAGLGLPVGVANAPPALVETARWGYVRLRLESYSDDDLRRWAQRLHETSWQTVHAYFMHEPTAPEYATRLIGFADAARRGH